MKTVWVLLVILNGYKSGDVLSSQVFHTKEACELSVTLIKDSEKSKNAEHTVAFAQCVEDRQ